MSRTYSFWRMTVFTPLSATSRRATLALALTLAFSTTAMAQRQRPAGNKPPAEPKAPPTGPKPATMDGALDEKIKFAVDKKSKRNSVVFTSKTSTETFKGTTKAITGDITLNPAKLDGIEGSFTVPWKSIDTGKPGRNEHMLSAPWIDSATHPDIVFTISGLEDLKAAGKTGKSVKGKFAGKMAMNGEERDVKIPFTMTWFGEPKEKEGLGIKSTFKINLSDYKIAGRGIGKGVAATQALEVSVVVRRASTMEEDDESEEPTTTAKPSKPKPPPNS